MLEYCKIGLRKNIDMLVTIPVILLSIIFFPVFGLMRGYATISRESFIISCIFISMWLLVLFLAIKFKSKSIFNMYVYYWLAVNIISLFTTYITSSAGMLGEVGEILAGFFINPIAGILFIITTGNAMLDYIIFIIITLSLFTVGFFAKRKII